MERFGKQGKRISAWLIGFCLLFLGAGCLPGIVQAGAVTLYTSEPLDKINEMQQDFERLKRGITMNIYRSGTQVVISKLQAEMQAGGMLADMLDGTTGWRRIWREASRSSPRTFVRSKAPCRRSGSWSLR